MKLQEYQAKSLLKQAGIPVPVSMLATNAVQVKRIASEIGCPVVLKAQILERGRGVKLAVFAWFSTNRKLNKLEMKF